LFFSSLFPVKSVIFVAFNKFHCKCRSSEVIMKLSTKRYYDYRLVYLFVGLFLLSFLLNVIISCVFKAPVLAEWIQVGPNTWRMDWGVEVGHHYSSLRISLCFFELFLGWAIAALLCTGKEEYEGDVNFLGLWVASLIGIPVIINFVSNLWIWMGYSLLMLVLGFVAGKRNGFALPLEIKILWQSVVEESTNLNVENRYGNFYFPGKRSLWIFGCSILGLLILSITFFMAAYNSI